MQLISELEEFRRGPYAGAVLYSLPDGTMDACIALRTMVIADGVAYLQAGAGVVARLRPGGRARGVPQEARRARGRDRPGGGGVRAVKLLMLDNYDSFTYNLVHLFEELGVEVVTVRNDAITVDEASPAASTGSSSPPAPAAPRARASRST